MIFIKDIIIKQGYKNTALYKCEQCNNEVEANKSEHNKKLKKGKPYCVKCTWDNSIKNRSVKLKPSKVGEVNIIEHLDFKPNEKRYVIAECPACKKHYRKRFDALENHPLCKSCNGLKGLEKRTKHGLSNHNLFWRWVNMKSRCEKDKFYKDVTVCEEWKNDFKSFYDWAISSGYMPELELDKDILCDFKNISPKIYSPETCLWITKQQNLEYSKKGKINK